MNQDRIKQTEEVVESLSRIVNVMGDDKEIVEAFTDTFNRQHRTLQASMIRVLSSFLKDYGKNEHFDARNEAAVALAKTMTESIGEYGPAIPHI